MECKIIAPHFVVCLFMCIKMRVALDRIIILAHAFNEDVWNERAFTRHPNVLFLVFHVFFYSASLHSFIHEKSPAANGFIKQ